MEKMKFYTEKHEWIVMFTREQLVRAIVSCVFLGDVSVPALSQHMGYEPLELRVVGSKVTGKKLPVFISDVIFEMFCESHANSNIDLTDVAIFIGRNVQSMRRRFFAEGRGELPSKRGNSGRRRNDDRPTIYDMSEFEMRWRVRNMVLNRASSIMDAEKVFGCSKTCVLKYFNKVCGKRYVDVRTEIKREIAIDFLEHSNFNVTEIETFLQVSVGSGFVGAMKHEMKKAALKAKK